MSKYKPNHIAEWYHCIVRLPVRVEANSETSEDIKDKFKRLVHNNACLIVHHNLSECTDLEGVSHYHVLWKHYKGSTKTTRIYEWSERWNGKLWIRKTGSPSLLREYLLQGRGREPIFEAAGSGFPEGEQVVSALDPRWQAEVRNICEPGKWEPCERPDRRVRTNDKSGAQQRNAAGIYARGQEQQLGTRLNEVIKKYIATDQVAVYRKLLMGGQSEDLSWWRNAALHNSFNTTFINAMALVKAEFKALGYIKNLDFVPDDPLEFEEPTYSIIESMAWINKCLLANMIDPLVFAKDVIDIMCGRLGKINCLYMYGAKDCGKTTLEASISSGFMFKTTLCTLTDMTSSFELQELVSAGVAVFNEPAVACKQTEIIKQLFEGNPLDTNVKYKDKQRIYRTPCIVTTNRHIWCYNMDAAGPIKSRIKMYTFTVQAPKRTKQLHPKVWKYIAEKHEFLYPSSSENGEDFLEGFSESQFGRVEVVAPIRVEGSGMQRDQDRKRAGASNDCTSDIDGGNDIAVSKRGRRCGPNAPYMVYGHPSHLPNPLWKPETRIKSKVIVIIQVNVYIILSVC